MITQQKSFVHGSVGTAIVELAFLAIRKQDYGKPSPIWNKRVQNLVHVVPTIIKPMTPTNQLNLSKWHLADVTTSSKGQKTCVLTNDHKPITFHLGSNLRTRFGASTFDKNVETSRKNLDFDITQDKQIIAMLKEIDLWVIQYIFDNAARILKKVMSKDVIKENYKHLVTSYGDNVRVKTQINTSGHRMCQFWDEDKNTRELPEDWQNNEFEVQVSLPQLWIMGSSFGLTLETTHLLVKPIECQCPF